jgi:hypothetical protein
MSGRIRRPAFDDSEFRYVGTSPVCEGCRHRVGHSHLTCAAFPERIPEEIWNGGHAHRTPYPNDGGLRYEAMTPEDWERQRQWEDEEYAWYLQLKERLIAEGKLKPKSTTDELVKEDTDARRAVG